MRIHPAFKRHPWMMWLGLGMGCSPVLATVALATVGGPTRSTVEYWASAAGWFALFGIPLAVVCAVTLRWPGIGAWLFILGGLPIIGFGLFAVLLALADNREAIPAGVILQIGVIVLTFPMAPIGGVTLLLGSRTHDCDAESKGRPQAGRAERRIAADPTERKLLVSSSVTRPS